MEYPPCQFLAGIGEVRQQFHVEGIPRTFSFDRDGKLIGETIDQCTATQFLKLLSKTNLHP